MIYYPISTLMLSGIREILLICTPHDIDFFRKLLGDGSHLGIKLEYKEQKKPEGLAQAFLIGEDFLDGMPAALILGDNIFHGDSFIEKLKKNQWEKGAYIFAYQVSDPERYGVINFNVDGTISNIEEKPKVPKSKYAMTGLYFCDDSVIEKAKKVNFSNRNELEITDIMNMYLEENSLNVELMSAGTAWLDTGTCESLHEASSYIRTLEKRQGLKVGCPEEVAWRNKWITDEDLAKLSSKYPKSGYGDYLINLI